MRLDDTNSRELQVGEVLLFTDRFRGPHDEWFPVTGCTGLTMDECDVGFFRRPISATQPTTT